MYPILPVLGGILLWGAGCAGFSVPPAGSGASAPAYTLSGGTTTGPLEVARVALTFSNGRGDITVPAHTKLGATAVIRFNGNGLFRAMWQVDGRDLEVVNVTVTYGDTLRLPMRGRAALPTFDPGPHRVTLNVLSPQNTLAIPEISYFVTPH